MEPNRILARILLGLAVGANADAQQATQPPPQAQRSSSSASGRAAHHIQVPDEDAPTSPPELNEPEAEIEKGNFAAAEGYLRKLVARDNASYVAWFDLGFVENALGNVNESIAAYRKSVAAKPDVFESNLNLGLQLAKVGQAESEKYLQAATLLKPTDHPAEGLYRAWIALGHTREKSNTEGAMDAYRRAALLQPTKAEPHLAAGMLYENENRAADAEQEYEQAITTDPKSSDAAIALANLYMHGGRFPEAETYLRKLLAEEPRAAAVQFQLGRVLAAEGKNDEAIAALQSGVKLDPEDEGAQRDLAGLFASAGKNELAESAYRALLIAHPNDADLHRWLGQAYLREKKFLEAQQEFATALKLRPDWGEAYGDLAFAAGENKDYGLAIRALDLRAKQLPEIPITYFLRASACDHLHDLKAAAANYHQFLKTANGKYPDQEWQARHRLVAIEPKK